MILAEALQKPREWLLAHPDSLIPEFQKHQAESLLHHYLAGDPLPYILQRQEFFNLNFRVLVTVEGKYLDEQSYSEQHERQRQYMSVHIGNDK